MRRVIALFLSLCAAVHATDGDIAPGFGSNGLALTGLNSLATNTYISAAPVVVQQDGKLVVCGSRYLGNLGRYGFFITRFDADGSLDMSFGSQGHTILARADSAGVDLCAAVAIQPNQRILVIGSSTNYAAGGYDFVALRLNPDGMPDPTFGPAGTGWVAIPFDLGFGGSNDDFATSVALQPDGGIVIAGSVSSRSRFAVTRLLPSGVLDGFGKVAIDFPIAAGTLYPSAEASSVAIDAADRIVVSGYCRNAVSTSNGEDFAATRLLGTGQVDQTFGTDGYATVGFDLSGNQGSNDDRALGMTLQRDGRIVLVGRADQAQADLRTSYVRSAVRLTPDGAPDGTFGVSGKKIWPKSDPTGDAQDLLAGVIEQSDGKLLLAGAIGYVSYRGLAMRLNSDGSSDSTFGSAGEHLYDWGFTSPSIQQFNGLAMSGADVFVSGTVHINNNGENNCCADILVARLKNDLVFTDDFD